MDPSAERIASNQSAFRTANENIEEVAAGLPRMVFICECADPGCTATLWLNGQQYERVRSNPRWFVTAPGHEVASGRWGQVVDADETFVVVEKVGDAGAAAEDLDPRRQQERASG